MIACTSTIMILVLSFWTMRHQLAEFWAVQAFYASEQQDYTEAAQSAQRAAFLMPYEENYQRQAAIDTMLDATGKSKTSPDKSEVQTALDYASWTTSLNPYIPENTMNSGLVRFVLSPAESDSESEGFATMIKGLEMSKYNLNNYKAVINGLFYKSSLPLDPKRQEQLDQIQKIAPEKLRDVLKEEISRYYVQKS